MTKALASLYIVAVLILVAAAVGILRMSCEGFGCMGIGVAWVAWVIAFFVVVVLGLVARSQVIALAGLGAAVNVACWLQAGLGVMAVAVWVSKNA